MGYLFSSPEPKAHMGAYRIGRHPACVRRRRRRPSSTIFKDLLL